MKPTWIFDLDNTLHNANPYVFPHINRAMTDYLQRELNLSETAANELRERYWRRYGTTLSGLIRHHGTDPGHFLWHTHQLPNLTSMVLADKGLRHTLRCLPGKKILFTNGPGHYAKAVLRALNIRDLFADIVTIEDIDYRPKPQSHGFRVILRKHGLRPGQCIMVEDSRDNLRTAKRLGMRTVWLTRDRGGASYADLIIARLSDLPRALGKLR